MYEYNKILALDTIARRYLVMNSFDGVLTIIGILIGAYSVGINDSRIIIAAGLGAGINHSARSRWLLF